MSGNCYNTLFMRGDAKDIEALYHQLMTMRPDESIFSLLLDEAPPYEPGSDRYIGYYGTANDITLEYVELPFELRDEIYISFETEWTPPLGFVQKLSEQRKLWIELLFNCEEGDVKGRSLYVNGVNTENDTYSYMEGLYAMDESKEKFDFFDEMAIRIEDGYYHDIMEEDRLSPEKLIEKYFSYLKDKYKKLVLKMLNEAD